MYTEDLQHLSADKDVGESCIFDFPDNPGPQEPPVDPPICFPHCPSDDWPPPPPPPPPDPPDPPPPPAVIVHGAGFLIVGCNMAANKQDDGGNLFDIGTLKCEISISSLGYLSDINTNPPVTYARTLVNEDDEIIATLQVLHAGGFTNQIVKDCVVDLTKLRNSFPLVPIFLIEFNMEFSATYVLANPNFLGSASASAVNGDTISYFPFPPFITDYLLNAKFYLYANGDLSSYTEFNGSPISPT